jgi:predicted secreted protein
MFNDSRSKKLILVAHCILNQNSISDGTAEYPGSIKEVVNLLLESQIGILQMPCPELHCLGLDRGNIHGGKQPVLTENSRIRRELNKPATKQKIKKLVDQLVFQIEEYIHHGFLIKGIVSINRSPSCGVNTTSMNDQEVEGKGVFIEELEKELEKRSIKIDNIGIKASKVDEAISMLEGLR